MPSVSRSSLSTVAHRNDELSRKIIDSVFFFNSANSESQEVSAEQEVILSAIAHEMLLAGGAYRLAKMVAEQPEEFASIPAKKSARAQNARWLEEDPRKKPWPLHKLWAYEFYQLRNCFSHGNDLAKKQWVWRPEEHLVMASFLYPLLVKVLLSREGKYTLSDNDQASLGATDKLLDTENWGEPRDGKASQASAWQDVLSQERTDRVFREWDKAAETQNDLDKTKSQPRQDER